MVRAKALGAVSHLARAQGDFDWARGKAEEAVKLGEEIGEEGLRASLFVWGSSAALAQRILLSDVSDREEDLRRVMKRSEELLALGRQAEDSLGIAWSLFTLAFTSSDLEDFERAEKFYAEGLNLSRELGSAFMCFAFLSDWGVYVADPGRLRAGDGAHTGSDGAGQGAGINGRGLQRDRHPGMGDAIDR